jgi:hypothetical protein
MSSFSSKREGFNPNCVMHERSSGQFGSRKSTCFTGFFFPFLFVFFFFSNKGGIYCGIRRTCDKSLSGTAKGWMKQIEEFEMVEELYRSRPSKNVGFHIEIDSTPARFGEARFLEAPHRLPNASEQYRDTFADIRSTLEWAPRDRQIFDLTAR